jgi:alanine-glyoxylate transaminase/serine-glyoxylate transaminase/serine-pyruvate transaminase
MIGHMDPEVFAFNDRVARDLKTLYGAGEGAFTALLSGTGSLGMEAGFANLWSRATGRWFSQTAFSASACGDGGASGSRGVGTARAAGRPLEVAEVRRAAFELRPKLMAVVHGETSTGSSTRCLKSVRWPARWARSIRSTR